MSKVYCDTSIVIEYVLATGREPEAKEMQLPEHPQDREDREFWESLLNHDKRLAVCSELRSAGWHYPGSPLVISPFVLLELDGWHSEEAFKRLAVDQTHVKAVQRTSQKNIGKHLQRIARSADADPESVAARVWGAIVSSPRGEHLAGIAIEAVEDLRFDERAFAKVAKLALLQLGMADIVHLLAAESLGCTHFATMDSDFHRLRDEIHAKFEFKVPGPEELLGVVRGNPQ